MRADSPTRPTQPNQAHHIWPIGASKLCSALWTAHGKKNHWKPGTNFDHLFFDALMGLTRSTVFSMTFRALSWNVMLASRTKSSSRTHAHTDKQQQTADCSLQQTDRPTDRQTGRQTDRCAHAVHARVVSPR